MKGPEKGLPEALVADDIPQLVKPGIYDLVFVDFRTAMMFMGKAPKLVMDFRIVTLGQYFETQTTTLQIVILLLKLPAMAKQPTIKTYS